MIWQHPRSARTEPPFPFTTLFRSAVDRFEHQLPPTGHRPAPERALNRRPLAEMLVQIAPRDTRSRNPEYTIQNKAMVPGAPATPSASFDHERLKAAPLFVAHQTTDQGNLPKTKIGRAHV